MRPENPIAVAVGELGSVVSRGLLAILEDDPDLRVVGAGLDHAALQRAVAEGEAQVVFLDEDGAARPSVPRGLCETRSSVGLVVLAHRPTRAYATRIVGFGVTVCLSTDASAAEIVHGVRLAAAGRHVYVSMSHRPAQAGLASGLGSLTRREREVLSLLSRGQTNGEIAEGLQISAETARTHTKHVYRKLGASSRTELLGIEQ